VLAENWQRRLRELGERGDILKQMHHALDGGDGDRFHVVRPGQGLPDGQGSAVDRPLVGRVVRKGLGDELSGRALYAVVETPTRDAYHLTLAARVADSLRIGDLVSFATKREPAVQPVDRHLAEVAAAHGGVYEVAGDAGGRGDVARLAARRLRDHERAGLVASRAPGQWSVPSDLLERLERRHREVPARYRVSVEALALGLDAQVRHPGPVWLDTLDAVRLTTKGLGAEVRAALERRREVLRELGIGPDDPERAAKITDLKRLAVGRGMARESGQAFLESAPPGFRGHVERAPEGSAYLAVSDGMRFVLVPATREGLALTGKTVELALDAHGRVVGLRAPSLDRGR